MKRPKLRYVRRPSGPLMCPREDCEAKRAQSRGPASGRIVRHGSYWRSSDRARIERYFCPSCRSSFSQATTHPCFGQKKRQVNFPLWGELCSGVSLRRVALLTGLARKTVDRKLRFLGQQAPRIHEVILHTRVQGHGRMTSLQFDEMESFEHTKCKPVSIPLI